ncbi:uncharacterized protein [Procambarus clarkii]|uniref:uncharacterized protein n=1 Tax=Procambarus clarkii TaxID=6728 RepID=UPI001E674763|nr:uncharacterized protein LOC123760900 [Procambarus clarkii]XP_045602675.1 uncharacterized protein LOC123760900 [Procambarus clarkii]XP_045602676.1 uncharacterized protein LOC123760900 [Procambarus clarkii]
MGDRSLPPQVDGHPQGRLDLIFGRPAIFPPAKPTQSYIFTFRWWGDTRPCILRLPPEKSEARITYYVTCGPQSFRQYLCDSKSLHVNLKIGGGDNTEAVEDGRISSGKQMQSPRKAECDTPRQKLLRRQLRLKKGWQDGDVIGIFILPDLKLNSRGDYVYEGRIIDSCADIIGTVVVTMVFMEGTLEDFQQIKIQNEEQSYLHENNTQGKTDDAKSKPRASGIPILGSHGSKSLKTRTEGYRPRSRSGSFRDSLRQKCDKLRSPKKHEENALDLGTQEKENQAPHRTKAGSFTKVGREDTLQQDKLQVWKHSNLQAENQVNPHVKETDNSPLGQQACVPGLPLVGWEETSQVMKQVGREGNAHGMSHGSPHGVRHVIPQVTPRKNSQVTQQDSPQVVRRERKSQDGIFARERPASWGLYPLLDGADPHSLVDSGAVKAEDLPILLQVLRGRSPNLEISNLDPETQKLLDGLDLSTSSISADSSGRKTSHIQESGTENHTGKARSPMYSVFKSAQNDNVNFSGVSMTSGIWPLEEGKNASEKSKILAPKSAMDKIISRDNSKFGSPRRVQQGMNARTKIPTSQVNRTPVKACRTLISHTVTDEKPPFPVKDLIMDSKDIKESVNCEKIAPSKYGSEDEGSVLIVDIGTLILAPPLLPPKPLNNAEKVSGVRVMHRSRVCYLTTLDVNLPGLDIPPEWEMAQTCASRQLVDHEINYNVREVLRLPPATALEVLRGHLIVRCVCRRLGERDSEEVGSASISLMDLWQLNGSQVNVPLFRTQVHSGQDSLTRRQGKKGKKREECIEESFAQLTFTARLGLALGRTAGQNDGKLENLDIPSKAFEKFENSSEASPDCLTRRVHLASKSSEDIYNSEKLSERDVAHRFLDSPTYLNLGNDRHPITDKRQSNHHLKPRLTIPDDSVQGSAFNSIYAPTHINSNEKVSRGIWQYPASQSKVEIVNSILGHSFESKTLGSNDTAFQGYHGSFLTGINGYENPNNKPIESGGESPCIRTASEFTADFINYDSLSQKPAIELKREERGGTCRIHLEILKGRNLPLLEGPDGTPRPPNSYVRTTIGSHNILTNVYQESDNPVWSFATDVLLPYSQLTQTDGSLILKVHHTQVCHRTSVEDLLLGFVCVDATSIWSGHVSLCGWYPLLDLRGAVRGHVKVSLTPHEPPQTITPTSHWFSVSLQEHTSYYPPSSPCQSRHSYPQYTTHASEVHSEPQHLYSRNDTGIPTIASLDRSSSAFSQLSPRSRRRNYSQAGQCMQDHSSVETGRVSNPNLDSHLYTNFSSVVDSESVTDDHIVHNESGSGNEISQSFVGVPDDDHSHYLSRKTSNIPIFSHNKISDKTSNVISDKAKQNSALPKVLYKEDENVCPNTSVVSQGYCRHKGSIIVKGVNADFNEASHLMETPLKDTSNYSSCKHPSERENVKMFKDSIILSHFQMQKKNEMSKESKVKKELIPSNIPPGGKCELNNKGSISSTGKEYSSTDNQQLVADQKLSENRPSSCLKVPGSPSLRAKHVTFAHKLVHHQCNDAENGDHCSQDKTNRRLQLFSQMSRTPQATSPEISTDCNIDKEGRRTGTSRGQIVSQPTKVEESDLQVVPCREGDTQIVTTTVSVQGSKTLNAVPSYGIPTSCDKNRADLIMAFSWMNQTSGYDTPCVSYIESKQQPKQNSQKSYGNCTSSDSAPSADIRKTSIEPNSILQKKSRKFRSRLAANFSLK